MHFKHIGLAWTILLACRSGSPDEPGAVGAPAPCMESCGVPDIANNTFEYVVVGSGAGGGPLAARLAEAGYSVLLLEAGENAGDKLQYQVPVFHPFASEDPDLAWSYFVEHYAAIDAAARDSKRSPAGILYP